MPYILNSPPPHNYECTSSISCKKQAKVLENEKHLPLPNNLKIVLCIHVLVPTIITIIIHTKQQMKITWMVNHVQIQNGHSPAMKTTIQAQHFHNTKMKNLTLHTKLVYNNKMSWNLKSHKLGLYLIHIISQTYLHLN